MTRGLDVSGDLKCNVVGGEDMAFKDKEVCLNSIPFNRLYSIGEKGASCRPENITSKLTSDLDDISNFSEYGQTAA